MMTATAKQLAHLLLTSDPYEGFPIHQFPPDEGERPQGWGDRHFVFEAILSACRPNLIIEVGSWKGASAIQMALLCKELKLNAALICVDTWLGSPEHVLKRGYAESLNRRWGHPQLYHTFVANVLKWQSEDMIVPFPATSENAAVVFAYHQLKADVIYIDAAHEYKPALRDFQEYWMLLNAGGYLIGDDYISWEGVTKAADEFAQSVGSKLIGGKGKFVIRKGGDVPADLQKKFARLEMKRLLVAAGVYEKFVNCSSSEQKEYLLKVESAGAASAQRGRVSKIIDELRRVNTSV
jgi:cephalosporin hydroxylase